MDFRTSFRNLVLGVLPLPNYGKDVRAEVQPSLTRSGYRPSAIRRIHTQVQVLHVFAYSLDGRSHSTPD
jgi:hypothetical protein